MVSTLTVLERQENGVCVLTLNRPDKKNALSIALRDEVTETLKGLAEDEQTKVVLITGAGSAFSAGFDLEEFGKAAQDPDFMDAIWKSGDPFHEVLLKYPLPLIAAVNGVALGGGMDLAVLCDIRIAGKHAAFGHPEVQFGDVVYAPLHDLIGGAHARDLCLTGRRVDATEALRLGLVSEVVPTENLLSRGLEIANEIARSPRRIILHTKAKIISRAGIGFTRTLEL